MSLTGSGTTHRDTYAYACTHAQRRSYSCKLDAATHARAHTSHRLGASLCVHLYVRVLCNSFLCNMTTPRLRLSSWDGQDPVAAGLAAAAKTTTTAHGRHCRCSRPPPATSPTSQREPNTRKDAATVKVGSLPSSGIRVSIRLQRKAALEDQGSSWHGTRGRGGS